MKVAVLLFASLISTSLIAKTTVKIPLIVELDRKNVSTAEVNKIYNLTGENKLLEFLVVENTMASIRAANKTYWNESARVDKLATKLDNDLNLTLNDPDGSCYTGKATEAVEIFGSLADGPFSDQQGFWGWKYKNETHYVDSEDNAETNEALNSGSALWKNWKGNDESILIIYHISDDGDDMNESVATKCK
ncbi:MAG: hypothetical protein K2Q18_07645 [Bdellovibrionales bacterium]|nr:hypothetical protein [Bdellovibrionales bacterium]